jgi:hypothetical protein
MRHHARAQHEGREMGGERIVPVAIPGPPIAETRPKNAYVNYLIKY